MKTLPPCDHDECPPTRCTRTASDKAVVCKELFDDLPVGTAFRWKNPRWWHGTLMDGEYVKGSAINFGPPDDPMIWEAGCDSNEPVISSNRRTHRCRVGEAFGAVTG